MTPPDATQTTGWWPDGASRVGAGVTPFQTDAEATIRLAVRAEELGYARFGTAEGWTNDAVVVLTQIAGVTSRIGLATAVLPVWSRTPAAIAMAAAGLQRASGGRFALGLGASSPPLVEGLHGLTWQRPVDRMRTTLVAVRALLDGARLPLDRARSQSAAPGRAARKARADPARRHSPRPRSVWRVSWQTIGCPSSGPVPDSPTAEPCSPRARRLLSVPVGDRLRRQRPARDR